MTLLPIERQERILELLEHHQKLLTHELSEKLNTSAATIRRDLNELAEKGLVARTHGGIVKARLSMAEEPAYAAKAARMKAEKSAIAMRAAAEVHDGATVIMDSGTTIQEVAKYLAGRHITVIALDLPAAQTLAIGETEVLLVGGRVRSHSFSVTGHWAEQNLQNLHADLFLMGAHAVDERGVSNAGLEEAVIKQTAIRSSNRTVLLADHSKFGERALIQVCELSQVDTIISDQGMGQFAWLQDAVPDLILV